MALALAATLLDRRIVTFPYIVIGMVIGGIIGLVAARAVKMTAMPQMVALFNGAGGGAAALVATAEFLNLVGRAWHLPPDETVSIMLSTVIGSISFAGSIIAFIKLQELITGRPITYPGQQVVNAILLIVILGACGAVIAGVAPIPAFAVAAIAALVLGVLFVLPIGGADMPVVISLLNACTGLAAAATGFVLGNSVLIISGALVGASGTLLTLLMGKAMNRSVTNVLFGAFGKAAPATADAARAGGGAKGNVRTASQDDVATMLAYARQVVIVPGYGISCNVNRFSGRHDVEFDAGGKMIEPHRKRRLRLLPTQREFHVWVAAVNHDPVAGNVNRHEKRQSHDVIPMQMGHEHMVGLWHARAKSLQHAAA